MASNLYVVVGGQYGSEGKGAVAGRICADMQVRGQEVVNVRVGGPNAGHTVIGRCPADCGDAHEAGKHPWRLRQVPVGAVTASDSTLVIAAGSEVDPYVLADEIGQLNAAGYDVDARLIVDRSATVLTGAHVTAEQVNGLNARIGSTSKGIGAARSDRIWRQAQTWDEWASKGATPAGMLLSDAKVLHQLTRRDTSRWMSVLLNESARASVVIEGTQGYGLGLHTGNYPKVTSGDCRAIDFLAQAGISPWQQDWSKWGLDLKVVIAVRPHPIRVAGDSGWLRDETTWEELGLPVEHTTVTRKVRRVGAWDPELVQQAVRANGGPRQGVVWMALTMADSVEPRLAGIDQAVRNWAGARDGTEGELTFDTVSRYLSTLGTGAQHLGYVGTGPDTAIINERMYD